MQKSRADEIITKYLPKIYGFAVEKAFFYDEAEEIASDIVEEVYRTLLRRDEIVNLDGYIWQISNHCFAKYVAAREKRGISLDNMSALGFDIPDTSLFPSDDMSEEILILRREIAFLTTTRRRIVYSFYFENKPIAEIADEHHLPVGTVKWHLNKAKNTLKRGFTMERKIGKLGLCPIETAEFGHSGNPGSNYGPESYLSDKLSLNIVYACYYSPKTRDEIAEELGMTPVFIDDKLAVLEENGFIVRLAGDKFTTYVRFSPLTCSIELDDKRLKMQKKAARLIVDEYLPKLRAAISDIVDVYIPTGNRELFEAAMLLNACADDHCALETSIDLSKYRIKTTAGGDFIAFVWLDRKPIDPDYVPTEHFDYAACGSMTRESSKYPVYSWSIDSKYSSRKGAWQNNLSADYEFLYEYMTGAIIDCPADADKMARLREREFIGEDGKINVMIVKGEMWKTFEKIPALSDEIKQQFADIALEYANAEAKFYPEQMRDLVIAQSVGGFISNTVGIMVKDIIYGEGIMTPLTERERITSDLIMFCDRLPE